MQAKIMPYLNQFTYDVFISDILYISISFSGETGSFVKIIVTIFLQLKQFNWP